MHLLSENLITIFIFQEASDLVEFAYNEYANAPQRLSLLEDFYGPSFILFKVYDFYVILFSINK